MILKILLLVCCVIAVLIILLYDRPETDLLENGQEGGTDSLRNPCVVPTPDYELSTNQVYCASFQLAWQALKEVVGEDVIITGNPEMVERLNRNVFCMGSLKEKDYYVNFGFGKEDIINKINNDLIDRFGIGAPDRIRMVLRPEDMIIYAYIFKNLEFPYPFDKLEQPISFQTEQGTVDVKGYGIASYRAYRHRHFNDQVDILYYNNEDDFVIGLNCADEEDEYLLAKIKPGPTLKDTCRAVCDKISNGKKDYLREKDSLIIPYINIDITRKYNEIVNRPFLNSHMKGYYISEALQNIKFSAGEKGTVVSSEAKLIFSRESLWKSRRMVFSGPFMVILKRKGPHEPYLMIWIHDVEWLIKA